MLVTHFLGAIRVWCLLMKCNKGQQAMQVSIPVQSAIPPKEDNVMKRLKQPINKQMLEGSKQFQIQRQWSLMIEERKCITNKNIAILYFCIQHPSCYDKLITTKAVLLKWLCCFLLVSLTSGKCCWDLDPWYLFQNWQFWPSVNARMAYNWSLAFDLENMVLSF